MHDNSCHYLCTTNLADVHHAHLYLQVDRDGDPTALGEPRSKVLTLEQMERFRSQRTAREKKAILKTEYGVKRSPLMRCWNYPLTFTSTLEFPVYCTFILCRSTPVETLHTILLGPYKYLLRSLIGRLTTAHKDTSSPLL